MSITKRKHFVIVGGGASGVLLTCHLLRGGTDDVQVTLIEKRPNVGYGTAYSTDHQGHLLNVRAANMSAFADDPGHFCRWLVDSGETLGGREAGPLSFAPRSVYGRYINSLLEPHLERVRSKGRLRIISASAHSIAVTGQNVEVGLDDGSDITGDVCVLATGHEDAVPYPATRFISPWTRPANIDLPTNSSVLILGTGLTMVDFVLSLKANGHAGPIYAVSRRGQLSQTHRPVTPLTIAPHKIPFGRSMLSLWVWLRELAERTEAAGGDWRSAVDAVRPYTWELWRQLPIQSQRRFLRHARAWWEAHRHRMAPAVSAEIEAARRSGQLRIMAAKMVSIAPSADGAIATFRPRGRDGTEFGEGRSCRSMYRGFHRSFASNKSSHPMSHHARLGTTRSAGYWPRRRIGLRNHCSRRHTLNSFVRRRPYHARSLLGNSRRP